MAATVPRSPSPTVMASPSTQLPQTASSGMKYSSPEPITGTIRQVGGQITLEWKSVGSLMPNEQYFVEITADNWRAEEIVCSLLTRDTKLVLPPTNSPPCITYAGIWEGYKRFWWHDDYNYTWRISVVETDSTGKILRRISEHGGGYIFWRHQ